LRYRLDRLQRIIAVALFSESAICGSTYDQRVHLLTGDISKSKKKLDARFDIEIVI